MDARPINLSTSHKSQNVPKRPICVALFLVDCPKIAQQCHKITQVQICHCNFMWVSFHILAHLSWVRTPNPRPLPARENCPCGPESRCRVKKVASDGPSWGRHVHVGVMVLSMEKIILPLDPCNCFRCQNLRTNFDLQISQHMKTTNWWLSYTLLSKICNTLKKNYSCAWKDSFLMTHRQTCHVR